MEGFTIKGDGSFIEVRFLNLFDFPGKTRMWGSGRYDVKAAIEVKSGNFNVKSILWTTTGDIYDLYQNLKNCNKVLCGEVFYISDCGELEFKIIYDNLGHVNISGKFVELSEFANELKFEFISDQTYVAGTLQEMAIIAQKYGDNNGVKI